MLHHQVSGLCAYLLFIVINISRDYADLVALQTESPTFLHSLGAHDYDGDLIFRVDRLESVLVHSEVVAVHFEPLVELVLKDVIQELFLCDEVVVFSVFFVFTFGTCCMTNSHLKQLRILRLQLQRQGPPPSSLRASQTQGMPVWIIGLHIIEGEILLREFIDVLWFFKEQLLGVVV